MDKKLLVIFHLYYPDQLDWFLEKMSHIKGCGWDLLVTGNNIPEDSVRKIKEFKPNASFLECENIGYDVWPFLKALKNTDFQTYPYILKIHTKNSRPHTVHICGEHLKGFLWRDYLVNALIGSDCIFSDNLQVLEKNPDIGMICARELYGTLNFKEDHAPLDEELERLGLKTECRDICAGTMMIFRSSLLAVLPLEEYTPEMFPRESASNSGGTPAHVYERVFSLLAPAQGYKVHTVSTSSRAHRALKAIRRAVRALGFIFSIDRLGEEQHKYLTILGIKIRLD